MRKTIVFVCVLLLCSCGRNKSSVTEVNNSISDSIGDNKNAIVDVTQSKKSIEALDNWLTINVGEKTILKKLGNPESKSENEYWDATGTFIQRWEYLKQGLELELESNEEDSAKHVFSITIIGLCKMKTSQNIKINSKKDDIIKAYNSIIDKNNSNDSVLVVGSIYEGTIFYLNNDIVNKIFIGGLAE